MKKHPRKTILLVEDDASTIALNEHMLKSSDYNVLLAKSGEEAVQTVINNDEIALVLMDIELGSGMDGTEAAKQILAKRHIPIVFLSSHMDKKYTDRLKKISGYSYVAKNSGYHILESSVEMALNLFEARQKIHESESRFRAIIENAPFGYFRVGKNGLWEYVNPAWEQMHSLSSEEVIGKSFEITQPSDMLENAKNMVKRVLTGETITGEFSRLTGYGLIEYHEFNIQPVKQNDEIVAIEGFIKDITDRKRADENLQRIKVAFDSIDDAIGMATTDGRHFYQNKAFESLFGYKKEELFFKPPAKIYKSEEIFRKVFKTIMTGESWCDELEMIAKNGRHFTALLRAHAIKNEEGNIIGLVGVHTDITERKKTIKALLESEEQYRTIFDNNSDAMMTLEPPSWHFTTSNQAMVKMFKAKDKEEFMAYEPWRLSPEKQPDGRDSEEKAKEMIEKAMREGFNFFEWTHKRITGEEFTATVILSKITQSNKTFLHATVKDISEFKRTEKENERLEAQLNMEQKMESVGRLAGGIAHDFNNVLGVIVGHTELAMKQADSTQPLYADLEEIQKAATYSTNLIHKLLAFASKQTVIPHVLDINNSIEEMLSMLHGMIGKDIDLIWKPGNNLWPVHIDPSQVDQIMVNLCANARDAIAGVGEIAIETKNIVLDKKQCANHVDAEPGEYVLITVSDNGCGMDKDILSHAFEPFFSTKEAEQGIGLGLSTIYGIARQNKGFVHAYSEENYGSTIKLYLSRSYSDVVTNIKQNDPAPVIERGNATILLVEDEPAILTMTKRILEEQGYVVLAANNPVEAIKTAEAYSSPIHLLLTDMIMPEMNGLDLANHLAPLYPSLKFLFMSGYTANVMNREGMLDKDVFLLEKPFSIQELLATTSEVLLSNSTPKSITDEDKT